MPSRLDRKLFGTALVDILYLLLRKLDIYSAELIGNAYERREIDLHIVLYIQVKIDVQGVDEHTHAAVHIGGVYPVPRISSGNVYPAVAQERQHLGFPCALIEGYKYNAVGPSSVPAP